MNSLIEYDRAARVIYSKLAKLNKNYNLNTSAGLENAKADIKKLEKIQKKIEKLTGNPYPIKNIVVIKGMIEKGEALFARKKRTENFGLDTDDFVQRVFEEKFEEVEF